jgi:hypothetical protein
MRTRNKSPATDLGTNTGLPEWLPIPSPSPPSDSILTSMIWEIKYLCDYVGINKPFKHGDFIAQGKLGLFEAAEGEFIKVSLVYLVIQVAVLCA